ncbi:MAG: 23S rRNA (adenine(2030)-N(6))-methyltransferase RlmJ [Legionellaceae bacterium]|nr:23S rRNA (adenine(2030)-N(6))-methyltransferase RlmJ [Legionellaceae bacterium]
MLSYQHSYHAGCFADVIKHFVLTRILDYMVKKDKPLLYMETHAGRGIYDLKDKHALKTGEAAHGIELLWNQKPLPEIFSSYIEAIQQVNHSPNLRYYPGSPNFAIQMLRSIDRLVLCERHPKEFEHLTQLSHQGKRVLCQHTDGIKQLDAQLPPPERRGLIFIDPSYELKTEYRTIPDAINSAHKRFSTGVYCLWYPLIDKKLHEQLIRRLATIDATNYLRIEFNLNSRESSGMAGCGLWIINPPYTLTNELKVASQFFKTVFNPGFSSYLLETSVKK